LFVSLGLDVDDLLVSLSALMVTPPVGTLANAAPLSLFLAGDMLLPTPEPSETQQPPMKLIQILLPVADNSGRRFDPALFDEIERGLTERFGGVTAYARSPARGRWRDGGETQHDDVIVVEVMTESLDREWWRSFRTNLEQRLSQETIIMRTQDVDLL
jgi:hypothetical protein